jgi:hypothetical protein
LIFYDVLVLHSLLWPDSIPLKSYTFCWFIQIMMHWFYFLAIVDNIPMDICIHVLMCMYFIYIGHISRSEITTQAVAQHFEELLVFQSRCITLHSHQQYKSPFFHIFSDYILLICLNLWVVVLTIPLMTLFVDSYTYFSSDHS